MNLNFLPVLCGVTEYEMGRVLLNKTLVLRAVKYEDKTRLELFSKFEGFWRAVDRDEIQTLSITFGASVRRFVFEYVPDWLP